MKNLYLLLTATFLCIGIAQNAIGQTYSIEEVNKAAMKNNGKYAIMVDRGNYLMASIVTGQSYKMQSQDIHFEIVLIGAVLKDLASNGDLQFFIGNSSKFGIRIIACEFTMNRLGVDKDSLTR